LQASDLDRNWCYFRFELQSKHCGWRRFLVTGFPRSVESIEKVLNCEIGLQDLEKSIEYGQCVHTVLKKKGNSKFSHLFT